jgi:hypothetical protein
VVYLYSFFNLCVRCWVANATPRPRYPRGKRAGTDFCRKLDGPYGQSGRVWIRSPEHRTCLARNETLYRLRCAGLLFEMHHSWILARRPFVLFFFFLYLVTRLSWRHSRLNNLWFNTFSSVNSYTIRHTVAKYSTSVCTTVHFVLNKYEIRRDGKKIDCSRISFTNILLCILCGCVVMIHYIVQLLYAFLSFVMRVSTQTNVGMRMSNNKWQGMCKESWTVKYIILFT